jgi:hypothetical protein
MSIINNLTTLGNLEVTGAVTATNATIGEVTATTATIGDISTSNSHVSLSGETVSIHAPSISIDTKSLSLNCGITTGTESGSIVTNTQGFLTESLYSADGVTIQHTGANGSFVPNDIVQVNGISESNANGLYVITSVNDTFLTIGNQFAPPFDIAKTSISSGFDQSTANGATITKVGLSIMQQDSTGLIHTTYGHNKDAIDNNIQTMIGKNTLGLLTTISAETDLTSVSRVGLFQTYVCNTTNGSFNVTLPYTYQENGHRSTFIVTGPNSVTLMLDARCAQLFEMSAQSTIVLTGNAAKTEVVYYTGLYSGTVVKTWYIM